MSQPYKIDGLCVCGHNPAEDPNEDCERCWLVTQIHDLKTQACEDIDTKNMLRSRLAEQRARADQLEEIVRTVARDLGCRCDRDFRMRIVGTYRCLSCRAAASLAGPAVTAEDIAGICRGIVSEGGDS